MKTGTLTAIEACWGIILRCLDWIFGGQYLSSLSINPDTAPKRRSCAVKTQGILYGGKQRLAGDEIMFNCKKFYSLSSVKYLLDIRSTQ